MNKAVMIKAFSKSIASLGYPRIQSILMKSILITLVIFALLGGVLWFGVGWLLSSWMPVGEGWLSTTIAVASFLITLLSGFLLFRVVAVTVVWFFSDDIVEAIEQRDYPIQAVMGKQPNIAQSAGLAIRSLLRVIGYNLLALPLYLLLLVTGIGTPLVFLIINALLLGRDLEDMLGQRHGKGQKHMSKADRLLLGLAGTAGMMVPIVNFVIPVIATAMAVHIMHGKDNA